MTLSIQFILQKFNYVFNNEFNSRKILHSFTDKSWGSYVMMCYVSNTWDFQWRGKDYYYAKCDQYKKLERTLILTEDKNGKVELFAFWLDFTTSQFCYNKIKIFTDLPKEHRESCNAVKKYFV